MKIDAKLNDAVATLRSEAVARASKRTEVQEEAIEERLQMKLNGAIKASRLDCHKCVDIRLNDISAAISTAIEKVKRDSKLQEETRTAGIESRMQEKLWKARTATQMAVTAIEDKVKKNPNDKLENTFKTLTAAWNK
ncbi:hypothetical protein PI124_g20306 [Phytophthora idaei]|nr:hypothetical protein PI125_g21600 [Phytophthora idaei]KAG3131655.1 hypothetical protein PI126_g19965 [Phytophthora idaei]KAG3234641.1 hypothetical protein PI124_g20306 [Phytophthora idaei]